MYRRRVIEAFERVALDYGVDLPVDDAIAGLARVLADEPMPEAVRAALQSVGATLYRVGLEQRMRA